MQACNDSCRQTRAEGRAKGKGRAAGPLVQAVDMCEFGDLRFASACEGRQPAYSNWVWAWIGRTAC